MAAPLSEQEVDRQLEDEFRGEARDIINTLELALQQIRTGGLAGDEALRLLRREASNLKLRARSVAEPVIKLLSHRLDDYASGLAEVGAGQIADLQVYLDRIGKALDGEEVPAEGFSDVVRALPARKTFEVGDVTVTDIEVLLVVQPRSAARVIERELINCGYRVTISLDPFEALELAVQTKPDLVITGMVMGALSGVDIASALAAMPSTSAVPVAVITSLAPNHTDLKLLPLRTAVIRRGTHFGDDLAHALQRFDIT